MEAERALEVAPPGPSLGTASEDHTRAFAPLTRSELVRMAANIAAEAAERRGSPSASEAECMMTCQRDDSREAPRTPVRLYQLRLSVCSAEVELLASLPVTE